MYNKGNNIEGGDFMSKIIIGNEGQVRFPEEILQKLQIRPGDEVALDCVVKEKGEEYITIAKYLG